MKLAITALLTLLLTVSCQNKNGQHETGGPAGGQNSSSGTSGGGSSPSGGGSNSSGGSSGTP